MHADVETVFYGSDFAQAKNCIVTRGERTEDGDLYFHPIKMLTKLKPQGLSLGCDTIFIPRSTLSELARFPMAILSLSSW